MRAAIQLVFQCFSLRLSVSAREIIFSKLEAEAKAAKK
jgi:hypothetical protein